ncbi:filaggrin isoform X7 [Penaeus vannamei]|uniref:filaggrin isoform X7 n=1 Tax=Penaeus vannamei TaxID=6689 RepID=UPI00387F94E5
MREHLPGVGQPLGTPPHHRRAQDPAAGDIARSDSYSLARGGKLVSSRPWASSGAQILVNMHALEASAKDAGGKEPRRPPSSGTSSSDSESDSDSSDSDDTSEDEYEVRVARRPPALGPLPLAEEDEALASDGECKAQVASAKCSERRQSEGEERLPGDGHSRPHLAQDAREGAGGGAGSDHDANHDEGDDEEEDEDDGDEDDESESDETESTVRARLGAGAEGGGNGPGGGGGEGAAPPPEEDPNDTLSTLSGDLSFDDRDLVSPPRENGVAGAQELEALPQDAAAPAADSHTAADAEAPRASEERVASESRVPPEGERSTPQRESVPAGVFCLSGYPKQASSGPAQDPGSRSSPSGQTRPQPEQESGSAADAPGEMNQGCRRAAGGGQHSGGAARGMGAVQGRAEEAKERSPRSLPFPPKYVSGHSRVALLRGTWDPSAPSSAAPRHEGHGADREPAKQQQQQAHGAPEDVHRNSQHGHHGAPQQAAARAERQGAAKSKNSSALGDGALAQHAQHARQSLQQAKLPKQSNAQHSAQVYQLQQRQQQVHQHQKRRVQQQQQQQQESRRHHGGKNGAVNPANTTAATTNSRDAVCGGSGTRSPAHAYQPAAAATPTSSMPRLHASSSGLGGSASRLSAGAAGGAAGSYPGLAGSRLGGSYTGLVSSASSGYGSTAGGVLPAAPSRHEDSEDLSDVSSGATSEDSARRRRRRSAQSAKGEASVSGNEDFEWVRASPMLTGLLEGHVTRLATPPDHRGLRTSLATPPESGEEGGGGGPAHRHRQYPRPPPAPRPRTLEPTDLVPHRPLRDGLRDSRDRLYSPSRDLAGHRRSRDSSVERSGRDSSCERGSVSSLHQHAHHHHHHAPGPRLPHHACDCPSCWCDEDEPGYDSCDERHHHHRHSYHEGLHHAHLHSLPPHHHQTCGRDAARERRARGQGSGDSGRSSPGCCRHCHPLGSLSSLSSHDYCANSRLALPCASKVGGALATLQGARRHRRLDSDYIALWSCHSPPGGSLEDRVNRLEGDKDSLQLQVTVLSEQVEAQTEKIADLENLLEEKKELLRKTEEQLQKEVMTRTSLETQRLELFSEISNLKLRQAAFERENADLRDKIRRSDHQSDHAKAQPVLCGVGRSGSGRITPTAASTPIHSFLVTPDSPQPSHQLAAQLANSPSPSSISTLSTIPASSPNKSPAQPPTVSPASSPVASHDAREFLPPRVSKTPPPNARRKIDQFGTMPRQRDIIIGGEANHGSATTGRSKGVMFAETEMQMIDDLPEGEYGHPTDGMMVPASSTPRVNTLVGHRSPPMHPKATGIKKIFTKLRRSSSGHLDSDLGDGDFRRGGMRATASARLGWTSPTTTFKEPGEPFTSWSTETMEAWLGGLGLSQYCAAVRCWTENGHHLSQVTPQQLERELGLRHPLHRKKLQLAIAARLSGNQLNTPLARLDHAWVLRWLDDVGLPQYKDAFSEARIDGRVLNCLTYDDLAFLRFTNLLHVTSLKRGIQVLREHNFDPTVLKRRSVPEEDQRSRTPAEVALWTNHRVMEWLRTVDLSEYAPNLRGSGVHGALMVYEIRFTSELLASLLSIPSGKTLLRRHLNTHFKELVGASIVQEKRELEASSGYTPLTTSAKVKMPKKSQFSLKRKKSKSELEFDDLLCPLDEKPPVGALQDKEKETNGDGRLC